MNEVTPPWRAFSSEAQAPTTSTAAASTPRRVPRWLAPGLAAVGGVAAGVAAAGLVVATLGILPGSTEAPSDMETVTSPWEPQPPITAEEATELIVDVSGAVADPGLHRLQAGDRVGDAIEAAGGFAPRADLAASSRSLNLAQPLEDGTKVLVPELGIDRISSGTSAGDGRIDINHAGRGELESLPGIGPVTAEKIIQARETERFGAARELRSRGLVGEKVYEDIESLIRAS